MLAFIRRLYQGEESTKILTEMAMNKPTISLVVIQVLLGMMLPQRDTPGGERIGEILEVAHS